MSRLKNFIKIVITQNLGLSKEHIERLKCLGKVKIYNDLAKNAEEWLNRCNGSDIICTGKFGLKTKIYELKNVFFVLPFVCVGFLDTGKLRERNITVSYCPGCNKDAVSEWIIGMIINLLRDLPHLINNKTLSKGKIPEANIGLTEKRVVILGKGNIGSRAGKICKALDMDVNYFQRSGNLAECVKSADIIINALSLNPSSVRLLDGNFFKAL